MDPPLRSTRKGVCLRAGPDAFTPVLRAAQCAAPTKYGERSVLSVGAGPRPARGRSRAAPTAESGLGALVRQSPGADAEPHQSHFSPAQAPSGAGRDRTQALLFLRAGNVLPTARGNPRNGGPGERRIWTRSVHPEPSPGDPLVSFPSLGKKLAARRRRNSPVFIYFPMTHSK